MGSPRTLKNGASVSTSGGRAPRECKKRRFMGGFYRTFASDLWSKDAMDALLQDLRYACRTLLKNPGFATLTIVCLALGIGVNSTIFSVVDTVAIRPLPFRDAHELVALRTTQLANGIDGGGVSFLDVRDWRER